MKLLEGKNALITGGTRGIGEAIVRAFADQGASVAFTFKSSKEKAQTLEKELGSIGKVISYQSEASSLKEAEKLLEDVLQEFENVDVLVNNAGITQDNLLLRMTEEQWDQVMEVNLKSVFNLTKQIGWHMLKQKKGSIINISSIVGMTGNAGQSNYAASKAGIIGFTKSVAQELGSRNIRCNAITPGFINTDMTKELDVQYEKEFLKNIPLNRLGDPVEVANAALFLASDLSNYITGQVTSVCGGMYKG